MKIWMVVLIVAGLVAAQDKGKQGKAAAGPGLTLTTTAFADGAEIPAKYTQSDPNPTSPQLDWTNVPANTVSFVLHMHDPDVALQKTVNDQLHWMLFNIPGTARSLPEGILINTQPADGSIQIKNGGGVIGYRGPGAAAVGPHHHYTFELIALDTKLELGPEATRADVLKAMDGHILGKAVLVGRFHR
jgi:Raf kinase inhibitor-like YbhB/YbcL family protein